MAETGFSRSVLMILTGFSRYGYDLYSSLTAQGRSGFEHKRWRLHPHTSDHVMLRWERLDRSEITRVSFIFCLTSFSSPWLRYPLFFLLSCSHDLNKGGQRSDTAFQSISLGNYTELIKGGNIFINIIQFCSQTPRSIYSTMSIIIRVTTLN